MSENPYLKNKPKNPYAKSAPASVPAGDDPLDSLMRGPVGQAGLGALEGFSRLPGLPLDAVQILDNFARRNLDNPEMTIEGTPLEKWGGQGFYERAQKPFDKRAMDDTILPPGMGQITESLVRNLAYGGGYGVPEGPQPQTEAQRIGRKAGNIAGGAVVAGPAGMLPAVGATIGSEGGRALDKAAPQFTKGYGEAGGTLLGGVGPSVVRRSMVPRTSPEQAHLAQELMGEGVPIYPGQLATNPVTRNVYDLSNKLSVYDNMAQARQSDALSRLMARGMGENETDLRAASAQSFNRLRGTPDPQNPVGPKLVPGEYDQIYGRIGTHPIDQRAMGDFGTVVQRAQQLTGRSRDTVMNAIQNIGSAVNNGRLTIRGYKDLTDQGGVLHELSNNVNPAVAHYGNVLRQVLENNIMRQASPADAAALRVADSQWRHRLTLENTIANSANAEGQISPALVQSALARASGNANARGASGMPHLETIAQAGKSFLKNPISSGTAERNALVGLLTGGVGTGGFIAGGPVGAAAGVGTAVAAPLAIRHLLQRQWLTRMMINDALRRGVNPNTVLRTLPRVAPTVPGATQQQTSIPPARRAANARLLQQLQQLQQHQVAP